MSQAYIPKALRQRVAESARHRCGYCLTPEWVVGTPMQIDHIIPEALGGPTREENLWLACPLCNNFKGAQVAALDPVTGETVRLFNPRTQSWPEHFAWEGNGSLIIGLTPTGRATVIALPQSHFTGQGPSVVGRGWLASAGGVTQKKGCLASGR